MKLRSAVIALATLALLAPAAPALADTTTSTVSGSIDFTGVTTASHVVVTAYAKPGAIVARSSLQSLGATSVDFTPGGPAAVPYSLAVPTGSSLYLDVAPTTGDDLVSEWWIGSGGAVAGAYPLIAPITAPIDLGATAAVRSGSVDVALEYAATYVCLLRLDDTQVKCSYSSTPTTSRHFTGIYPGHYRVVADSATLKKAVTVTAGGTAEIDFTEGGVIIGYVRDTHGKPIPDLSVAVVRDTNLEGTVTAVTDAHGRYVLASLHPGTAHIAITSGKDVWGSEYNLRGGWATQTARPSEPIAVTGVAEGRVTKAKTIVLQRKGKFTARIAVTKNDVGDVYVEKDNRLVAQVGFTTHQRDVAIYARPGRYRVYVVDKHGARHYASRSVTIHAGSTTRLGTVSMTKATRTVRGTVPGLVTGIVRLGVSSNPDAAVRASARVTNGAYTLRSVVPGVYWAVALSSPRLVSEISKKLTVTKSRQGISLVKPVVTDVAILLSFAGTPLGDGGIVLDGQTACPLTSDDEGCDNDAIGPTGAATVRWRGRGTHDVTVDSPIFDGTPYYFALNAPTPDLAAARSLVIAGIGGT